MDLPSWASFCKIKVVYKNIQSLVSYISIKDFEVSELIQFISDEINIKGQFQLFLRTPNTILNIESGHITDLLEHIAIIPSGSFELQKIETFLELRDTILYPINTFTIPICTFQGEFVMDYTVNLHTPIRIIDICYSLSNMFDVDSDQFIPSTYTGEKIIETMPINLILQNKVYIAANLEKNHLKSARKRANVVTEILKNEELYLKSLNLIMQYIIPFINKYSILNTRVETIFESFYMTAMIIHQDSLKAFQENGTSFFSTYGTALLKLAMDLNSYNDYVSIFPSLKDAIVTQREKNPQFAAEYAKIEAIPELNGLEIISLLVRPVQRAPNYRSHILRLIEATPPGHPDYSALFIALEKMNDTRRQQDKCEQEENSEFNLQKELPGYKLPDNEFYVDSYKVTSAVGANKIFVLSSNWFRILSPSYADIYKFEYIDTNVRRVGSSVFISHPTIKKPIKYIFEQEKFAKEFDDVMQETSQWNGRMNSAHEPGLKWKKLSIAPMKIQRASAVFLNEKFYVIGGRDECGIVSNKMMIFDGQSWAVEELPFPARHDLVSYSEGQALYMYGGEGPSGQLSDFWVYQEGEWKELPGIPELCGSGLAMCGWHGTGLILSGGSPFKTYYFDFEKQEWSRICEKSPIPDLKFHSMHELNRRVYIVGGNDNSTTYVMTSLALGWIEFNILGIEPTPRIGHSLFVAKEHIWLFGGAGSSIPFCLAPVGQWFVFKNEYQFPKSISFASVAISDNNIYVFGGRTDDGISDQLYTLEFLRTNVIDSDYLQSVCN
ncbi:Kelch motif family protein [Trichomonas vaginalis G3]|uniref:Kelch motif family protein n=1 Tax=Trichomonas vaginalis (strain ATCC PRA-98 / G3) TaxID=412133 RepID=A2FL51_TRIV3|nr:Rho guanyl-nucleotide exchange factor protein [Trichomonas vaginalis G3]EAX94377.1 Kelch motif family protein [Trichomonas vaginalis G3]KAI5499696.1 Rho guanyl-nucleotide exchange factor protein [Trichomonas vaginalis G3]|eukprot:XP_001307307.1 Kelch motif family protein [Trichomonas vaginalis G3]